ncbi:ATP-binding protein [Stakelama flava]|uniref:ATP-binding protein n=1 Tax=Stakelama flava TaxID=2860338 RepID=UPI001FE2A3C4|nr:ATP-binding protein [Stakelama flava]
MIRFEGASAQGHLSLRICDNGPGIPAADRERIFEPFFTTHRARGGSGLGLAIARSLLEASDGAMSLVVSEAGAVFELKLPSFITA